MIPLISLLSCISLLLAVLYCPIPRFLKKPQKPQKTYTFFDLREILKGLKK